MVDNTEQDDEIIELTQLVEEDLSHGADQDMIELDSINTQAVEIQEADPDSELKFDAEEIAPERSSIESTITQEQVELALERVIEKKFGKIIEERLVGVMEKVIEREIADMRNRLEADLDKLAVS